jgi:glycine/D-amino acid oxidase-like deaminating enzyme
MRRIPGESPVKPRREYRTGVTYWRAINGPGPAAVPLAGDAACEVAVVGGGISGALTALLLVREGRDTLLVDKAELAAESTAASTGLLQYEIDTPLIELISHVGEADAVHAYRRGLIAIDELEALADSLPDRCGFERVPSLYRASSRWHLRQLKREAECRKSIGIDVEFLGREALRERQVDAPGALWSPRDGQLDPYRLTCHVLHEARRLGLRMHHHTEVTAVERLPQQVELITATGKITAQHIVYATGYAVQQFVGHRVGRLRSTYVVTSRPLQSIEGWPERCLIWETARPYFYARQTGDGRAMIGGEDTAFASDHKRDALVARQVQRLQTRAKQILPAIDIEPEFAWAGTFGETKDGMAFIGCLPERPREFFSIGFGGNGITFAMIAARTITDLIAGRPSADADVFRFRR